MMRGVKAALGMKGERVISEEEVLLVYVKKGHTIDFVGGGCLNDLILLFASRFLKFKGSEIKNLLRAMASTQMQRSTAPILILSDSDSDVEISSSTPASLQHAAQPRKRPAAAAGGNHARGPRVSKCEGCGAMCIVQVDRTPSNFGRNVSSAPAAAAMSEHHSI